MITNALCTNMYKHKLIIKKTYFKDSVVDQSSKSNTKWSSTTVHLRSFPSVTVPPHLWDSAKATSGSSRVIVRALGNNFMSREKVILNHFASPRSRSLPSTSIIIMMSACVCLWEIKGVRVSVCICVCMRVSAWACVRVRLRGSVGISRRVGLTFYSWVRASVFAFMFARLCVRACTCLSSCFEVFAFVSLQAL